MPGGGGPFPSGSPSAQVHIGDSGAQAGSPRHVLLTPCPRGCPGTSFRQERRGPPGAPSGLSPGRGWAQLEGLSTRKSPRALGLSGLPSGRTPAEVLSPQEGSPACGMGSQVPAAAAPLTPPCFAAGAAGVRRAALGEAVLPAVLQRVQGPRDHHVWGELPSRPVCSGSPEPWGTWPGRPARALCSGRGVGSLRLRPHLPVVPTAHLLPKMRLEVR